MSLTSDTTSTLPEMESPIQPGETWSMTVLGKPAPQGSKTARVVMKKGPNGPQVVYGKGGRPIVNMTEQNRDRLKPWRACVADTAVAEGWPGLGLAALDEAVQVRITFYFLRPASHYGTGRNAGVLKDSAPLYPETTGDDLDKLARAALDALTGIVWKDDKRVVTLPIRRRYGGQERMEIAVTRYRARTVGDLRRLRGTNPVAAQRMEDELQLDLLAGASS